MTGAELRQAEFNQMQFFLTNLWQNPERYFSWITVVTFSICVHEAAHAWTALQQGDSSAARRGYLTLNPLKVMGPPSLIMLAVVGFAWGAVPVRPSAMRRRFGPALVAAAGPLANLGLAAVFSLCAALALFVAANPAVPVFIYFFTVAVHANAFLFVLNMMPLPLLDGWQVYALPFPAMRRLSPQKRQQLSWIGLLLIFLTPLGGLLWQASGWLAGRIMAAAMLLHAGMT